MALTVQPHVNLVARRKQELIRERRLFAKVQFVALVVVLGYIGLLVFVIMVKGFLTVSQNKLQESISEQELALSKMRPIEEKYLILMNKLALATDFLANRSTIEEDIRKLHDSLPQGVTFSSLTVGFEDSTMAVSLVAHDMYRLVDYMQQLEAEVRNNHYAQVSLSSIGRSRTGQYTMDGLYYLDGK
jgi:hypothetical protein